MERLDPRVLERISGPAWDGIRDSFLQVSSVLLSVAPEAASELTTIYVKYKLQSDAVAPVYAVAWIKSSKQFTVGLSLPDDFDDEALGRAPQGTSYKGLTKYFTVRAGEGCPSQLSTWARAAYEGARNQCK